MLQLTGFNVLDEHKLKETHVVIMKGLKFHCPISLNSCTTVCSGPVTLHLIMHLLLIMLSFVTAVVLLSPEMS
jgi:hypothetical protein